jgi:diguanylate cyclase
MKRFRLLHGQRRDGRPKQSETDRDRHRSAGFDLVALHQGTIRADSDGDGLGTSFTVRLPAVDGAPSAAVTDDASVPSRARLDGLSVLVVDDEPDTLEMMAEILAIEGADVLKADSAREALKVLNARSVDVVVSDLSMPGEDGFSLIGKLRSLPGGLLARLPVIALSAHTNEEVRQKAQSAGFSAYLAKPCSPAKLCETIVTVNKRTDQAG